MRAKYSDELLLEILTEINQSLKTLEDNGFEIHTKTGSVTEAIDDIIWDLGGEIIKNIRPVPRIGRTYKEIYGRLIGGATKENLDKIKDILRSTKIFVPFMVMFLMSCGKSTDGTLVPVQSTPDPQSECQIYDACTYVNKGQWNEQPVYSCSQVEYRVLDHANIPVSYFNGKTCLWTREDYHSDGQNSVQGPGPLAIPSLGL